MSALFQNPTGKEWMVQEVKQLFGPDVNTLEFYDLYCNGLGIPLGLKHPRTVAIDKNPYLIEFYRMLQRGVYFDPTKDIIWTSQAEVPFKYGAEAYDSYVAHWSSIKRELTDETLIVFYLLTQLSFKRVMRFTGTGDFNLPFGRAREDLIRKRLLELSGYVYKFQGWRFYCTDANCFPVPSSAAVYIDPPYSGGFFNYANRGWSLGDRELLASRFQHHKGPVVISDVLASADLYIDRGYHVRKIIHSSVIELVACLNLPESVLSKFLKVTHLQTTSAVV